MKLSLTTTISLASIVAAGAAAYAINVNVLEAPAASNSVATTAAPSKMDASVNGGASASSALTPITVQEVAISAEVTKYEVGTAGTVLLNGSNTEIKVSSITPASGWTSEPAQTRPDGSISVHFTSASQRIEFTARRLNGKIVTSVIDETPPGSTSGAIGAPLGTSPTGNSPSATSPSGTTKPQIPSSIGGGKDDDDDRDGDDHGDDDREDDHHEDDDDD